MAKKTPLKGKNEPDVKFVKEEYKIWIDAQLEELKDSDKQELRFPSTLNNTERRYVHEACKKNGLASKSRGKGDDRYLTVSKMVASKKRNNVAGVPVLSLGNSSVDVLFEYLQQYQPSEEEINHIQVAKLPQAREKLNKIDESFQDWKEPDAVDFKPDVELSGHWESEFSHVGQERRELPVWGKRDDILNAIDSFDVTIISGATGCGKSTQVPQYLLELNSRDNNVVCTQPRRLSAVALAERVASENGQYDGQVGELVGYSVRLEKRRSARTRLLYCTTGVLLRELAHREDALKSVTHLVIDEVHERDINGDFLLMIIREVLVKRSLNLRLILMSATMHMEAFRKYFSNTKYPLTTACIEVPGKMFHVHELFLEDVLLRSAFLEQLLSKYKSLAKLLQGTSSKPSSTSNGKAKDAELDLSDSISTQQFRCQLCSAAFETPAEFGHHAAFCTGASNRKLEVTLVQEDSQSNQPTSTFNFAAQTHWRSAWGNDQSDEEGDQVDQEDSVESSEEEEEEVNFGDTATSLVGHQPSDLLEKYQYARQLIGLDDDSYLDVDLVIEVLEQIERAGDNLAKLVKMSETDLREDMQSKKRMKGKGAVLIFLAGWDDITKLMDELQNHPRFGDESKYSILPLHSGVSSASQKKVFKHTLPTVRKIICSTNIAETSVTIDDVVYVIDAGTSKMKRYDPHTQVSSLTPSMIARASAIQRTGRAGRCRPGVCFRLYSRTRFESMQEEEAPEMQRTALEEVCLQTCLLLESQKHGIGSQSCSTVAGFLARAPDPPRAISVANAMVLLEDIGALDEKENLTPQGRAFSRLPLHPVLSRMVYFATVFGLRDIAATLSAFFSVGKDPFVIPLNASDRKRSSVAISRLAQGANSDLFTYYNAYQEFLKDPNRACREYFMSYSVMNTVVQTRRQILELIPRNIPSLSISWANVSLQTIIELLGCLGTFPNLSLLHPGMKKLISGAEKNISPHKTSVIQLGSKDKLAVPVHRWIVFSEMTRSKHMCTIRGCTQIMPLLVALFEGFFTVESMTDEEGNTNLSLAKIHLSEWIELAVPGLSIALSIGVFRLRIETLFAKALSGQILNQQDMSTIPYLLRILESEKTGAAVSIDATSSHFRQPQNQRKGFGRAAGFSQQNHSRPFQAQAQQHGNGYRGRGSSHSSGGRGRGHPAGEGHSSPRGRGGFRGRGGETHHNKRGGGDNINAGRGRGRRGGANQLNRGGGGKQSQQNND